MRSGLGITLLSAGILILFGSWTAASAQLGRRSDFALFDQTNGADDGAICAVSNGGGNQARSFVYYVTVTNQGTAGFVRVTYADADFVQYQIPAGGSFSFSQAAGGTFTADSSIVVSNGGSGATLVGSVSVLTDSGAQPRHPNLPNRFCDTCTGVDTGAGGTAIGCPGP